LKGIAPNISDVTKCSYPENLKERDKSLDLEAKGAYFLTAWQA
jgi:hypothetical protein